MKFLSVFTFLVVLTVADRVHGDLYGFFDSIKTTWDKLLDQLRKPVRIRRLGRGGKRRTFETPPAPTIFHTTFSDFENLTIRMKETPKDIALTTVVTRTPQNLKKLQEVIIEMGIASNRWSTTFATERSSDKPDIVFRDKIEIPIIRKPKNRWKPHHKGHNVYAFGRKNLRNSLGPSETESSKKTPIAVEHVVQERSQFDWDTFRTMISKKIKMQLESNAEIEENKW